MGVPLIYMLPPPLKTPYGVELSLRLNQVKYSRVGVFPSKVFPSYAYLWLFVIRCEYLV